MNIGGLSKAGGIGADTLRYCEKQGLLELLLRVESGYCRHSASHPERVRFIRSALSLGFTLAQIVAIVPQLSAGSNPSMRVLSTCS